MSQSDKEFDNVDFEVIIRKKPKIDMKQVKEVRVILEEIRPLANPILIPSCRLTYTSSGTGVALV